MKRINKANESNGTEPAKRMRIRASAIVRRGVAHGLHAAALLAATVGAAANTVCSSLHPASGARRSGCHPKPIPSGGIYDQAGIDDALATTRAEHFVARHDIGAYEIVLQGRGLDLSTVRLVAIRDLEPYIEGFWARR